jgi:hypothetical protein
MKHTWCRLVHGASHLATFMLGQTIMKLGTLQLWDPRTCQALFARVPPCTQCSWPDNAVVAATNLHAPFILSAGHALETTWPTFEWPLRTGPSNPSHSRKHNERGLSDLLSTIVSTSGVNLLKVWNIRSEPYTRFHPRLDFFALPSLLLITPVRPSAAQVLNESACP